MVLGTFAAFPVRSFTVDAEDPTASPPTKTDFTIETINFWLSFKM